MSGHSRAKVHLNPQIKRLDDLVDLGITAVEIMPVAQFPGERNWGYDGVFPFAVQHSYGGRRLLKNLLMPATIMVWL